MGAARPSAADGRGVKAVLLPARSRVCREVHRRELVSPGAGRRVWGRRREESPSGRRPGGCR